MQAIEPAIVKLSLMHSVSTTNHNPLISKYNIIDLIGKGTFGDIWKVFDTKTKKKYAMKTVQYNNKWSDKKRERMKFAFFKEGKKIISLNNIKSNEMGKEFIIKCKETIGSCFVMEIFGFNMEKYMKYHETNRLQISLATIRLICIQIFSAMSFIHGVGECMHCDLKPENILIDSSAKIKIIDFGNVLSFKKRLNSFNVQTLSYRAPEVLFGNHDNISSLIDMWSIGCILYQLFAINNIGGGHKRLFCSNNKDDVIRQIYHKLSPFPIYIYNKFNSLNLRNLNIYHNESNYIKLKTIRCYKLLCTLANKESDEFFYFIDLLSCLLDVNPLTRYTSEDAIRHKFIIQDSQQFNVKRIHPLIKSSNDNERQWRITQKINGCALYLKSANCDQFPLIITKRSLY